MPIKPLETFFDEINQAGWLVLNLFQIRSDLWQCNLQRRSDTDGTLEVFTEFAQAKTPHEAVKAAQINMAQPRNNRGPPRTTRGPPPDDKAPKLTSAQEEDQLERLLRAPRKGPRLELALDALIKAVKA